MRDALPPSIEAYQVDGHRCGDVLQASFGESAVPRAAQLEGADGLGEGALDTGPATVAPLPVLRLLVLAEVLQDLMVNLRSQLQEPRGTSSCPCTPGAGRTETAVSAGET